MKYCDICGSINLKENNFCIHCGCEFVSENICPHCGEINQNNALFCIKCNNQINPLAIDSFDTLFSDYNNEGKRTSHWFIDGVETYHRNMSHLVNGLIDAGFTIKKLNESYATEKAISKKPKLIEQRDHSYYVYFKAKKE